MNRREFILALGGAAAAWPLAARAQQGERMRRIGVLNVGVAGDPELSRHLAALQGELGRLGWVEGRNVRFEMRWAAGDPDRIRSSAAELVALTPDVILVSGSSGMDAMQRATRTVPVVFVVVPDPVGSGIVESLARPGRNTTGFMLFEYSLSGKWLELLNEIVPGLTRVAVLRDPVSTSGIGQFAVIQAVASPLRIDVVPIDPRDASEIESAIQAFARSAKGGLIVTAGPALAQRDLIFKLAAQHQLPTIYFNRLFVVGGGLMSYGPDLSAPYRRAAGYVDRILKGEKPADLPVQAPTKYELVVNLKTAKALGLTMPPSLLARADEVIQ